MKTYDLIVIGSGSGLDVANAAAQHGQKVAIIEKDRMGGTCLNRGCIPSKLLIHSADVAETIRNAGRFGIEVKGFTIDFQKIVSSTNQFTDHDSDQIRRAFDDMDNPKLYPFEGKFIDKKTLSVGTETISAEKILIACGTRPSMPKIQGLEGSGFITSDEALRLGKQPQVLTILGGGYIACEMAHFFGALGTKVNIIQRRAILLPREDEDISQRFTMVFSKKYNVYTGCDTTSVSKKGDEFLVTIKKPSGETETFVSDQLLVATGRTPNTDTLNLEKTGVATNEKGYVTTDEFLETSVPGIFALGDAVGRYPFKHSANHEAQYAYTNLVHSHKKTAVDYTAMPHAIFSSPQVAGVGYTEQELRQKGIPYLKSIYPYIDSAMGEALKDNDGFVKFLVEKETRKILGCHIIGTEASILIHEVLVAMRSAGGTIDSLTNTIFIHPSLSEVIDRAANSVE
ncbi:MAG: dihydrolipoyl dehydrogenase [Thaumarchaeota archaeon]|nr:dihydrolipoyl dehydrogenase [Nitrososphaerota archaeon]